MFSCCHDCTNGDVDFFIRAQAATTFVHTGLLSPGFYFLSYLFFQVALDGIRISPPVPDGDDRDC